MSKLLFLFYLLLTHIFIEKICKPTNQETMALCQMVCRMMFELHHGSNIGIEKIRESLWIFYMMYENITVKPSQINAVCLALSHQAFY